MKQDVDFPVFLREIIKKRFTGVNLKIHQFLWKSAYFLANIWVQYQFLTPPP